MYFLRSAIIIIAIFISLKFYYMMNGEDMQWPQAIADESAADVDNHTTNEMQAVQESVEKISASEAQALMHLSARHKELQALERQLRDKEVLLEATKQHVANRITELEGLKTSVKKLLQAYQKADEERIRSLVKIYENMKPQDAAQIFDDLPLNTVLQVIDNMKEAKVAALLARMRPEKARQITMKFTNNYDKLDPRKYNLCICE